MGHVFHPGHEALHGVTVVVRGVSGRLYLGRFHETTPQGLVLHDVATHLPDADAGATEWIERQLRFGVRVEARVVLVPSEEVSSVSRLVEIAR